MAKIITQELSITISKIVKDTSDIEFRPINDEIKTTLENVLFELVNDGACIIEVTNNE